MLAHATFAVSNFVEVAYVEGAPGETSHAGDSANQVNGLMKDRKDKTRTPILAAGGIVLRGDRQPQFAVVQLRKLGAWVLPKGKLAAGEDAIAAARREVLEETGHRVTIHEFLGTLAYEASRRPKVVQFWRMQALGEPIGGLMRDVKAVQWLALEDAIDRLTHPREQAFLEQVGPIALKSAERSARRARERPDDRNLVRRAPSRTATMEESKPFAPVAGANPVEHAPQIEQDVGEGAGLVPAADVLAPADVTAPANVTAPAGQSIQTEQARKIESAFGHNLIEKTLVWFRQITTHRPPLD